MKKYIIAGMLVAGLGFAEVLTLPQPQEVTVTVTGFNVLRTNALEGDNWTVTSEALLTSPDSLNGASMSPIRFNISVRKIEVATAMGIDVTAETEVWEAVYLTKTIPELRAGVTTAAVSKVFSLLSAVEVIEEE